MHAGGKPWVGRLQRARRRGDWPRRRAPSGRDRAAESRTDSAWAIVRGGCARARSSLITHVGVLGGDSLLVLDEVGGDPEQQAGVARLAGDEAADGVGDGQRTAQAADIAVGHQAGRHRPSRTGRPGHRRSRAGPARSAWPRRSRRSAGRSGGRARLAPGRPAPGGSSGRCPGGRRRTSPSASPGSDTGRPVAPGRPAHGRARRRRGPGPAACRRCRGRATASGTASASRPGRRRRSSSRDRSAI